jgi:hypothetical protein
VRLPLLAVHQQLSRPCADLQPADSECPAAHCRSTPGWPSSWAWCSTGWAPAWWRSGSGSTWCSWR